MQDFIAVHWHGYTYPFIIAKDTVAAGGPHYFKAPLFEDS